MLAVRRTNKEYSGSYQDLALEQTIIRRAIQVDLFTKMLQQGQTLRRERKSFKLLNEKLFNYWDKFNEHHLTTEQLLEKVAEMYTNFNAIKYAKNVNDSRSVELEH
jgi:hypothetical protein